MTAPSLDGRRFDLVSSTASAVDPAGPTRFLYSERDGLIWGGYAGDTVVAGRFVGTRDGDVVDVRFVHRPVGGALVTGAARSRVEVDSDRLRLVEDFEVDGVAHVSVCVEVDPGVPPGP